MERDLFAEAIAFLTEAEDVLEGVATDLKNRIAAFLQEVSTKTAEKANDLGTS